MFRGTLGHIARILAWLVAMPFIPLGAVSAFADDSPKTPAPAAQTVAAPAPSAAQKPVRTAAGEKPANALKGDLTRTRFLIGLDKTVSYSVLSLNNPNRVVVELPDVPMHLPADPGADPVGLVKSFRGGLSAPGKTRIVIDVTQPVIVETARLEKGADGKVRQLAIEIVPAAAAERSARKTLKSPPYGLGASGVQPPLPQPAKRATGATQSTFKPIIVIDPGHGGDDTGAVKNGVVEKDVVLAFSKVLRDKIMKTGRYQVIMTRDTDTFIPLGERVTFAERNQAALFIAVHADYASTSARGATIYSLRDNVANSLKRSAKGEVSENVLSESEVTKVRKASGEATDVSAVRSILSDLAEREVDATQERTSVFSRAVIANMGETTTLRESPEQQAGFRVLKTAKFPSVLIELAYVTNKQDAELLKSDSWREKVATSISTAVENYFSHQIARLPL